MLALPAEERCPAVEVRRACTPDEEDSEGGCPGGALGPYAFRQEFWGKKPVLMQGAAKECGDVFGGGFPVDREKFVERFGDDVVVVLSGGSDVVTPGTEAEQRLPFREAVAEITGPGSTRPWCSRPSLWRRRAK